MRVAWFWFGVFSFAAIDVALWAAILDRMTIHVACFAGMLAGMGMGLHAGISYGVERQARTKAEG
jgi:hypothetical protein